MNQQQHNHRAPYWGGGLYAFYWYQIFALDSIVVKTHKK